MSGASHPIRKSVATGSLCAALGLGAWGASALALEPQGWAELPNVLGAGALDPRVTLNDGCVDCHSDIAAEWKSSLHRRAFTEPVFQAALAAEPRAFCRSCHAPEADPSSSGGSDRHAMGVGCVTCHMQAGHIVTARADSPSRAPHEVVVDPSFGTDAACARCHEFPFPEGGAALMQETVKEHAVSQRRGEPCAGCHMKASAGARRKSHSFDIRGPRGLLRSSIRASARRAGTSAIVVSVAAREPGHAVPTGDLFRRIEARATSDTGAQAKPVVLARRFVVRPAADDGQVTRVMVGDDRLPPNGAEREVTLILGDGIESSTVRWEVVYRRMDDSLARTLGVGDEEIVLASGALPPKEKRK